MDGDIPQLLTNLQQYSTSFNCTTLPLITQQTDDDSVASDIDWVSLLSSSSSSHFDNQNSPSQTHPETSNNIHGIRETDQPLKNKGKFLSKVTKKASLPRIAFHTRSSEDVLDDGFRWRKYGQKSVKHSTHPRSYYRCTHHTCNVKKQIQRHSKDPNIVVTTYEGIHNHPCEKLMETLSPLLKQLQFLSSI